jgi:hypothetical protein
MASSAVVTVTPPSPRAPVYSNRYFLRNDSGAVRIPPAADLMGLQNAKPFWIPILDTNSLLAGAAMPVSSSLESNHQLTADFAWLASIITIGQSLGGNPSSVTLTLQMFRINTDSEGNQTTVRYQKLPIQWPNVLGGQRGVSTNAGGANPFYLRKPVLLKAGAELLCRVQNNFAPNTAVLQIALFGYIEG